MKSWGEEIWEEKIKSQGEVGVICGSVGSLKDVNERTRRTMSMMDSQVIPLIKKQGKVLDIGVGPMARLSIGFAKRGFEVTGLDISQKTLEIAEKYIKNSGLKNISLIKDDLIGLDKTKGKFDFIFCIETLEHIPKHLSLLAFKSFNKKLNKKGFCFVEFAILNEMTIKKLSHELAYRIGHKIKKKIVKRKAFSVTCYTYTIDEVRDIFERTGFKEIKKIGNSFLLQKISESKI